ncbi:hypothetical protein HanIR_Chr03g0135371 [Helianthus annuus]|nr:hypothetical protein HanIR_Chr03g0135371 [Helianthus annuus]
MRVLKTLNLNLDIWPGEAHIDFHAGCLLYDSGLFESVFALVRDDDLANPDPMLVVPVGDPPASFDSATKKSTKRKKNAPTMSPAQAKKSRPSKVKLNLVDEPSGSVPKSIVPESSAVKEKKGKFVHEREGHFFANTNQELEGDFVDDLPFVHSFLVFDK